MREMRTWTIVAAQTGVAVAASAVAAAASAEPRVNRHIVVEERTHSEEDHSAAVYRHVEEEAAAGTAAAVAAADRLDRRERALVDSNEAAAAAAAAAVEAAVVAVDKGRQAMVAEDPMDSTAAGVAEAEEEEARRTIHGPAEEVAAVAHGTHDAVLRKAQRPEETEEAAAEEVEDPRRSCDANPERHRWNAVAVAAADIVAKAVVVISAW